jgi:hypothetical protein
MMQVNVKNAFNNVSETTIFRDLCDVWGPLTSIIPFIKLFYGAHSSLYYQHEQHVLWCSFFSLLPAWTT